MNSAESLVALFSTECISGNSPVNSTMVLLKVIKEWIHPNINIDLEINMSIVWSQVLQIIPMHAGAIVLMLAHRSDGCGCSKLPFTFGNDHLLKLNSPNQPLYTSSQVNNAKIYLYSLFCLLRVTVCLQRTFCSLEGRGDRRASWQLRDASLTRRTRVLWPSIPIILLASIPIIL